MTSPTSAIADKMSMISEIHANELANKYHDQPNSSWKIADKYFIDLDACYELANKYHDQSHDGLELTDSITRSVQHKKYITIIIFTPMLATIQLITIITNPMLTELSIKYRNSPT